LIAEIRLFDGQNATECAQQPPSQTWEMVISTLSANATSLKPPMATRKGSAKRATLFFKNITCISQNKSLTSIISQQVRKRKSMVFISLHGSVVPFSQSL
jgi:hypothetical protein